MADINQPGFPNNANQQMGYMNPGQNMGYSQNMGNVIAGNSRNPYNSNSYNSMMGMSMNDPYNYYNQNRGMNMAAVPQQNNGNPQNQFFKCRPVSSEEEARASQIDLDGSLWVFTDIGNKKMYTKQINNDGTATFKIYECTKDESPYATPSSVEYVTKDEFNKAIQTLMAAMQTNAATQPVQSQPQPQLANENKQATLMEL